MNFSKLLFDNYETFKETQLTKRRFKHIKVKQLIGELSKKLAKNYSQLFDIQEVEKSYQGREIYLLKIGTGKTKLLFWSQMHGDESTATEALFDIFNFFASPSSYSLSEFRNIILQNCTLYFVPMLNPDGAEIWQRRTAQEIDMNRDAIALQTPEARLLKHLQQSLKPDFGFNLHNQNIYYTAGNTPNCATISFLAPPINYERTIDEVRKKAMQVIGLLAEDLQQFIPKGVAKFSDEFEPRAFGDNIQRWGTSTILVESGGFFNKYGHDIEKQFIRKLNFVLLLNAAYLIANQAYTDVDLKKYEIIPQNEKLLKDLILRNVQFKNGQLQNTQNYSVDIAFLNTEITDIFTDKITNRENYQNFSYQSCIDDIGDLSIFYGYKELNCKGLAVEIISEIANEATNKIIDTIKIGDNPTLVFRNQEQEIVFRIVNGFVEKEN